tara:strand:+ start:1512 stop:2528 length:1017 start_codon:yes stop_codon:yes gene_type:complete
MNKFLAGFCLVMMLPACQIGITNSTEKTLDDTSEVEYDATPEAEERPSEDETEAEDTSIDDAEEVEEDSEEPLIDFSQIGPFSVTVDARTASVTDCSNISYRVYSPNIDDPPVIVLGHGFARGSDVMVGWAEHLASWGIEVLLPTLCHYNVFFGVDHEMNGQNMRELIALHGATNAIYAGHSAGGLAAIIAASQDPLALGVLGLDATDTDGVPGVPDLIGTRYAGGVTVPAFSITGEPSSCNAENNGLSLFRMMSHYTAVKVVSADHCDFENPTDAVCAMSCENPTVTFEDSYIRPVITTLGTAAAVSLAGLSPDGSLWWTEEGLGEWVQSGIIQKLE